MSKHDESGARRALNTLHRIIVVTPAALARIPEDAAARKSSDDQWSIKEELGHLIDSAMNNHRRLVRSQIEDNPILPDYDGDAWAAFHSYQAMGWRELIETWRFFNEWLLRAADQISPSGWKRVTRHVGKDGVTIESVIDDYVRHLQHHLEHLGIRTEGSLDGGLIPYPEKTADLEAPVVELIRRRWSPVAFDEGRSVEPGTIRSLLEAARWAPSCFNEQPWRYLVFDGANPEAREKARSCLVDGNAWAKSAPLLLLSVASEDFGHNGTHNRHAQHDTGMASENLVLEAVELGLAAHQMGGYDAQRARELFSIPDRFTPMAMIAIGYPYRGELNALPEKIKARETKPRSRKHVAEFAFDGTWEKSFGA
ncbi:MAG TPA: nitroreductase family protein [Blastocatellia bacterium]|nr:nitroreductase family protein [Blastocatellia bacterium]